ncbi:MAG: hypothetical protein HOP32_12270 [Nitrospira sp.]|nr:hypothetical protein [Nitrospira sp.]
MLHAAICKNWGYERLHEQFSHIANEKVGHSSGLIDHSLYLDGAQTKPTQQSRTTHVSLSVKFFSRPFVFTVSRSRKDRRGLVRSPSESSTATSR